MLIPPVEHHRQVQTGQGESAMRFSAKLLLTVAILFALGALAPVPAFAQGVPALRFLGFSPTQPPADTLIVRQAIVYAIDREGIVRAITPIAAIASPALAIQHPRLPGYTPVVRGHP
jgi:ABC-type transport system substrate-binding protein